MAMRTPTLALALLTLAAPAVAQPHRAPPPAPDPAVEVARRIADPATADKLAAVMQSLAKAVLDLPVGEIEAAAQGRAATAADKRLTVRDLGRREDPAFDPKLSQRLAQTRPIVEHSLKAIGEALPAVMQSLKQAGEAVERAAANMPDPSYPKR